MALVTKHDRDVRKSLIKHALTKSATDLAIEMALLGNSDDIVVVEAPIEQYHCTLCQYVAVTKQDVNMHRVSLHGKRHAV